MPYGPEDKPSGTDALPTRARMIFKAAANAIYSKYGADADARAHKVGWSAVKNAGFYKEKNGKWCKKDSAQDWNPDQPREAAGGPGGGQWTSGGGGGEGSHGGEPGEKREAKAGEKPYKPNKRRIAEFKAQREAAMKQFGLKPGDLSKGVAVGIKKPKDVEFEKKFGVEHITPTEYKFETLMKAFEKAAARKPFEAKEEDFDAQTEALMKAFEKAQGPRSDISRVTSAASELKSTMEGGPDLSTPKGRREKLKAMREGESGPRRDKARKEAETIAKSIGFKPSEADLAAGADIRRRLAAMREGESGPRKRKDSLTDRRRRIIERDPLGRELSTYEQSGRDDDIFGSRKTVRRDPRGREISTYYEEGDDDLFDALHTPAVAGAISDGITVADASGASMMYDAVELDDAAQVGFTSEGYLKAMPRIARTGIQVYKGAECNRPELDKVRIFRPADEVFKNDAWKTYTHLPVTLDHPSEPVRPDNWKQYAVGETGEEVMRDGTTARVPMMLRDAAAIQAYKNGDKQQLSVGYDCDIDWTPGVTDSGENYDAVQRNIKANHLAVVAAARGGPSLKIGDDNRATQENAMNLKTLFIDGIQCQMEDTAAVIVQRTIQGLQDQIENFKKKAKQADDEEEEYQEDSQKKDALLRQASDALKAKDGEIDQRDEALKAKDAEVTTLKAQLKDALDPAKRNEEIVDRLGVISKAKSFLGDKWIAGDKPTSDIRREVVVARCGDKAKEWSQDRIEGAFESLEVPAFSQNRDSGRSAIDDAVAAFGRPGGGYTTIQDERAKAYAEYDSYMKDAYKGQGKSN